MSTSLTPSGGRRRVVPEGRPRLSGRPAGWPRAVRGWVRLALACCRNAWIRSTRSSTRVANRWLPAAVALPGVEPVTLGWCRRVPVRLGDRPTQPDQAAPCEAGSLPSAHHHGRGAALQPDPGVNNPLTRYAPVCGLDCPAHRRSLTPCERTGGGCDSSLQATGTSRPPRAHPSRSPLDRPDLFGRQ